jgi:hypothetical protein
MISRITFSLLLFFSFPLFAAAQDPTPKHTLLELGKNLRIQKPLPGEKVDAAKAKFCREFLDDLKRRHAIDELKPIVETDDFGEPNLQSYLGECPNLQLNETISYEPRIWESIKTLPEQERKIHGTAWYSTRDFKLYVIESNQAQKNAKRYLFFGGGSHAPSKPAAVSAASFSQYLIVEPNDCVVLGTVQVAETINYKTQEPTRSFNGVLEYKGGPFLYDAQFFKKERSYSVNLYRLSGNRANAICFFETYESR